MPRTDPNAPFPRRLHVRDGKAYLIRDVYDGVTFIGCEYATLSQWTELDWHPCAEGVQFESIEPLCEIEP